MMSPEASGGRPLQYFIHDDCDALRMEMAGSFVGRAAQEAYQTWRRWLLMARPQPLVIDLSYVTDADEGGRAVLRAWRQQGARIVGSCWSAPALAGAADRPVPGQGQGPKRLRRRVSWLTRPAAGDPARAEPVMIGPAAAVQSDARHARLQTSPERPCACPQDGEPPWGGPEPVGPDWPSAGGGARCGASFRRRSAACGAI